MIDSCSPMLSFMLHPQPQQIGTDCFYISEDGSVKKVGEAYARQTDPQTSHSAAAELLGAEANAMEAIVLDAIKHSPNGLTNHEIVSRTGLSWNTATPRVRPLVRKGLVYDSGEKRRGTSNRLCIVWKVT